ncbi:MAG: tetratricopeptide repeat protein [Pseudomonadota bacterium]
MSKPRSSRTGARSRKRLRRPQDVQQALKRAVRYHGAGRLDEAEVLYSRILDADPDNSTALHLLGVVAHASGDNGRAYDLISKALALNPNYGDAHSNLGHVLRAQGRPEEALASFHRAVTLMPDMAEAHNNVGNLQKELGRPEDAVESYEMAITLQPGFAEAYNNYGSALQEMGRLADAFACFQHAVRLRPDFVDAYGNMGGVLRELGRTEEAADSYRQALELDPENATAQANLAGLYISALDDDRALASSLTGLQLLRRSEFGSGPDARVIAGMVQAGLPGFRLKHDVEQAEYLAANGHEVAGLAEFVEVGRAALQRETAGQGDDELSRPISLDAAEVEAILPFLQADLVYAMPDLPEGVLNPDKEWPELEREYRESGNEIIYIDDFLSADALEAFQRFSLVSRVWLKDYVNKYLGAFSDQGFISPLHLRLARDLQERLPGLFGGHALGRFWGFKYDSKLGKGINVHADFAVMNLNFWITPDEFNLDPASGGLKVYDVPSPSDWQFRRYNEEKEEIYKFIEENGGATVNTPYRCNRALLFNSAYFHETDEISFEDCYEGRRINITYLFGSR